MSLVKYYPMGIIGADKFSCPRKCLLFEFYFYFIFKKKKEEEKEKKCLRVFHLTWRLTDRVTLDFGTFLKRNSSKGIGICDYCEITIDHVLLYISCSRLPPPLTSPFIYLCRASADIDDEMSLYPTAWCLSSSSSLCQLLPDKKRKKKWNYIFHGQSVSQSLRFGKKVYV